jgi:hypothetical protein
MNKDLILYAIIIAIFAMMAATLYLSVQTNKTVTSIQEDYEFYITE